MVPMWLLLGAVAPALPLALRLGRRTKTGREEEGPHCRVCWEPADRRREGRLVQPCACSGTQAHVHVRCLRRCQEVAASRTHCPTCRQHYSIQLVRPQPEPGAAPSGGLPWKELFVGAALVGLSTLALVAWDCTPSGRRAQRMEARMQDLTDLFGGLTVEELRLKLGGWSDGAIQIYRQVKFEAAREQQLAAQERQEQGEGRRRRKRRRRQGGERRGGGKAAQAAEQEVGHT